MPICNRETEATSLIQLQGAAQAGVLQDGDKVTLMTEGKRLSLSAVLPGFCLPSAGISYLCLKSFPVTDGRRRAVCSVGCVLTAWWSYRPPWALPCGTGALCFGTCTKGSRSAPPSSLGQAPWEDISTSLPHPSTRHFCYLVSVQRMLLSPVAVENLIRNCDLSHCPVLQDGLTMGKISDIQERLLVNELF